VKKIFSKKIHEKIEGMCDCCNKPLKDGYNSSSLRNEYHGLVICSRCNMKFKGKQKTRLIREREKYINTLTIDELIHLVSTTPNIDKKRE